MTFPKIGDALTQAASVDFTEFAGSGSDGSASSPRRRWWLEDFDPERGISGPDDDEMRAAAVRASIGRMSVRMRGCGSHIRILTLTSRRLFTDDKVRECGLAVRRFLRAVRADFGGCYVWVAERHKSGHWHVHICIPANGKAGYRLDVINRWRHSWRSAIAAELGISLTGLSLGNVHLGKRHSRGRACSYCAKYFGKHFNWQDRNRSPVGVLRHFVSAERLVSFSEWRKISPSVRDLLFDFGLGCVEHFHYTRPDENDAPFCVAWYSDLAVRDEYDELREPEPLPSERVLLADW